jgi:hypothetical protein
MTSRELAQLTTMVPWADMLNHSSAPSAAWTFDTARRAYTLTALRSCAAGEEIFIRCGTRCAAFGTVVKRHCDSYGAKSNSVLLRHYGFCMQNNAADVAHISLDMPVGSGSRCTMEAGDGAYLCADPSGCPRARRQGPAAAHGVRHHNGHVLRRSRPLSVHGSTGRDGGAVCRVTREATCTASEHDKVSARTQALRARG